MSDARGSDNYLRLRERVGSLRRTFLDDLSPTDSLDGASYDRLCAFVVLTHAEIEQYLEDVSVNVLASAHQGWMDDRRPRTALMSLLAYTPAATKAPPDKLVGGQAFISLAIKDAREKHYRYAKNDNNGISERYLLALLMPVGIKESDLDGAWLQHMSDLARMRGQVAHHSSVRSLYAETPISLADALTVTSAIIEGLGPLDAHIAELSDELELPPPSVVKEPRKLP